jgi:hypothetical protein
VSEPKTLTEKAVSLVKRVPTLVLQNGKVRDRHTRGPVRRAGLKTLASLLALPCLPPCRAHPRSVITWRTQLSASFGGEVPWPPPRAADPLRGWHAASQCVGATMQSCRV